MMDLLHLLPLEVLPSPTSLTGIVLIGVSTTTYPQLIRLVQQPN